MTKLKTTKLASWLSACCLSLLLLASGNQPTTAATTTPPAVQEAAKFEVNWAKLRTEAYCDLPDMRLGQL